MHLRTKFYNEMKTILTIFKEIVEKDRKNNKINFEINWNFKLESIFKMESAYAICTKCTCERCLRCTETS